MTLAIFGFFLFLFCLIGFASIKHGQDTTEDYFTTQRTVSPALVALSAIATNHSGFMFIGQVGFIYEFGLQAIWITVGWKIGDFCSFLFVHKRFREQAEKCSANNYIELLSNWHGQFFPIFVKLASILSLVFLCTYAAAQFNAGSKALYAMFGLDYATGAVISAVILLAYTLKGGMRASIWTDSFQALLIIFTLSLMLFYVIEHIGGVGTFITEVNQVSESYIKIFPENEFLNQYVGAILFAVGWIFGGLGTIGQPHIMSRFLTLKDVRHMWRTRYYYYALSISISCLIIPLALSTRVILGDNILFDKELALLMLALDLLPDILLGTFLAGIFAATLSTADSQILASTSCIANIFPRFNESVKNIRTNIVLITIVTLCIALLQIENVFNLVLLSWSALASAFAPLLIVYICNQKLRQSTAVIVSSVGVLSSILWSSSSFSGIIYSSAIGISSGLIAFFILEKVIGTKSLYRIFSKPQ